MVVGGVVMDAFGLGAVGDGSVSCGSGRTTSGGWWMDHRVGTKLLDRMSLFLLEIDFAPVHCSVERPSRAAGNGARSRPPAVQHRVLAAEAARCTRAKMPTSKMGQRHIFRCRWGIPLLSLGNPRANSRRKAKRVTSLFSGSFSQRTAPHRHTAPAYAYGGIQRARVSHRREIR